MLGQKSLRQTLPSIYCGRFDEKRLRRTRDRREAIEVALFQESFKKDARIR